MTPHKPHSDVTRGIGLRKAVTGLALSFVIIACAQTVERRSVTSDRDTGSFARLSLDRSETTDGADERSLFGNYLAARYAGAVNDASAAAAYFGEALSSDPENLTLLQRTFLVMLSDGRVRDAETLAVILVERDPTDRMARLALAAKAMREKRYESARAEIEAAGEGGFVALLNPIVVAWAEWGAGRVDEAYASLARLDDRRGFDVFGQYHAGLIADLEDDPARADRYYRRALEGAGGASLRIVQVYGNFLERRGRDDEALGLYDEAMVRSPDHPILKHAMSRIRDGRTPDRVIATAEAGVAEGLYGVASVLSRDGTVSLPIAYLRLALAAEPSFATAQTLLADLYEGLGLWEEARDVYLSVPPKSPLYRNSQIQAAVMLDRVDRTRESISALRNLVTENPADADAHIALGDLLRGRERYAEAVEAYDKAVDLVENPETRHWVLYYARGICLEREGRWDEAENDLRFALSLRPEQPLVMNYLGYSWAEQGRNMEEAHQMVEQAVSQRPNDGYIVDSLGWVLYRMGRYRDAVDHLERASELRPEDPVINDHLGDAYWRVGRQMEARFQWDHALTLGPEPEAEPAIRKKLETGLAPASIVHPPITQAERR